MTEAELVARHVSLDGALHFRIERYEDGRLALGFEESQWHVHSDMLEPKGRSPEQVALALADDLLNDRLVIVIQTGEGDDRYSILDTIEDELEFSGTYARLEFRFWSGLR
ncbi:MAG: hypothetical protein JWQ89_345, partial [Devosia sp.]|uniref:hypothetical protein n=1 Tax=Devosia sp. TaxID=1871048 RepID=UPI0026051DBC